MSQSDSFIDEVTEEVRRDRNFALLKRYGWIALLVVVVVVGAAAWNEYQKATARAEAEALGDDLLSALQQADPAERVTALAAVEVTGPGQSAVRNMLQAGEAVEAGDTAAAVDRLMAVAETEGLSRIYRDLARFKALGLSGPGTSPADRRAGYEQLAAPGAPLRLMALEQIALTQIEEGDRDAAVATLRGVLSDAELTAGLRQRISQLMVALGEDPAGAEGAATGDQ
ncbi:hypothetical protein ATO6_21170 [Oceanicola sp. 22II-s10i]|uniref:tetratricopeptide repeat protein n=1 Tax=Oceanicola sp. 22II-s10i TaxID=1317116 RepID=UPI000B5282EE|nr:tetratricopeptide repeat protein [Oceanicola sp. 22II-s10i]OWU82966.1 hypothetical protein ATO6_21170 [Oceanicola sp. 22II-s10i]